MSSEDSNSNGDLAIASMYKQKCNIAWEVDPLLKGRIKVAVEHNLSFHVMDHLSGLFQASFPEPKIARDFCCKRTKTRSIIKNVMAKSFCHKLKEILKHS